MILAKRYCLEYVDGRIECFREGGFWYTEKGMIIKWAILGSLFGLFVLWFVGGYIHAKRRLKAGKPLLAYHRFLVPWQERKRYGQAPQNHFTFYNSANPYQNQGQNGTGPYAQRQDGAWTEPPPVYQGGDAPVYGAPPGATKTNPNQSGGGMGMEMPVYGGGQQSGVIGGGVGGAGGEGGQQGEALPPRPPQKAKAVLKGFTDRFRR